MSSSGRPGCPTPESGGVVAVADAVYVPTRLPTAHVSLAPSRCSVRPGGQPGPATVLPAAMGAGLRSGRWSRPWHAPGRWLGGTGSAVWLCHRGCTHAADQAACPQVARTDRAAEWPGTGPPHLDTTPEYLRLQRRGRQVR